MRPPEWMEEFTDNLEHTEVLAPTHISYFTDSEGPMKVAPRKRSFYTHFAKDQNGEVCKRAKITRAPCRKRTGEAVPRAEKFGDWITADHKVLNEGCKSQHNHRHVVVVQDLASQWNPCQTKTSQETEKSSPKFLEPSQMPKVINTDNSLEFGKIL